MRRVGLLFVLLIAASIACEPLIHTHPLSQITPSPCAVCVNAVGRLTPLSAAPIAPLVLVAMLVTLFVPATIRRTYEPLASRAPPAA